MRTLTITFVVTIGILACQPEHRIYSEHQELSPNVEWLRADVREFSVPIEDNSIAYDFTLTFRYATGYRYETVNVKVTETSPSGITVAKEYALKVREENGDYIGEPGLDIWDSEHLVEHGKRFEEVGTYTYAIEQNTPVDPLNFAMEIGIVVDKTIE